MAVTGGGTMRRKGGDRRSGLLGGGALPDSGMGMGMGMGGDGTRRRPRCQPELTGHLDQVR
jgi:hypothetical protein